jgi:hypothetical protein
MNGLQTRMALILATAAAVGAQITLEAEHRLAAWRTAHAFGSVSEEESQSEPRYSIVVRTSGEPLVEDESTIGHFGLSAGPLRFDIALFDECRIRSSEPAEPSDTIQLFEPRQMLSVCVEPLEEDFDLEWTDDLEWADDLNESRLVEIEGPLLELVRPLRISLPAVEEEACRAG